MEKDESIAAVIALILVVGGVGFFMFESESFSTPGEIYDVDVSVGDIKMGDISHSPEMPEADTPVEIMAKIEGLPDGYTVVLDLHFYRGGRDVGSSGGQMHHKSGLLYNTASWVSEDLGGQTAKYSIQIYDASPKELFSDFNHDYVPILESSEYTFTIA